MIETLVNFLKNNIRSLSLGIFLAYVLNTSIISLFYQSSKEVAYIYDNLINMCLEQHDSCAYNGVILLANTGASPSKRVVVTVDQISNGLSINKTILNLNAAKKREQDPIISNSITDSSQSFTIDNLYPGTLIKFEIRSDTDFNRELFALSKNLTISVQADGKVISGDPQGTEMGRLLMTFL